MREGARCRRGGGEACRPVSGYPVSPPSPLTFSSGTRHVHAVLVLVSTLWTESCGGANKVAN